MGRRNASGSGVYGLCAVWAATRHELVMNTMSEGIDVDCVRPSCLVSALHASFRKSRKKHKSGEMSVFRATVTPEMSLYEASRRRYDS